MRTLSTATDISRPWRMALSAEPLLRFHGQDPRFPDELRRGIGEQAEHLAKSLDERRNLSLLSPDRDVHIEGRPRHPPKKVGHASNDHIWDCRRLQRLCNREECFLDLRHRAGTANRRAW